MRVLCLFLAVVATQGARFRHSQAGRIHGQSKGTMNPEAVAHTLAQVEDEWLQQAISFAQCNASDASASSCVEGTMGSFVKSCKTVVVAIVEGAGGDKDNIRDYLGDVCGQGEINGQKQEMCGNLTVALDAALTADAYVNREELNFDQICTKFMTQGFMKKAVEDEQAREAQERKRRAEEAAEAKKKAEEEEKAREAQEKAEAAQAKAEAAKKAAEEAAKKREEAQREAAEAKRKEAEAADAEAKRHEAEAAANVTVAAAQAASAQANASTVNVSAPVPEALPANTSDAKPALANNSTPANPAIADSNATVAAAKQLKLLTSNASQPVSRKAAKYLKLLAAQKNASASPSLASQAAKQLKLLWRNATEQKNNTVQQKNSMMQQKNNTKA